MPIKPHVKIEKYQSWDELRLEHPEIKSATVIYHAPRGQSPEKQLEGVKTAMLTKTQWSNAVFQIGDLFYIDAANILPAYVHRSLQCQEH